MAVQKPQKPLAVNGQDIYPLTSADQVIMEDGSRLNAAIEKFIIPAYTTTDYGKTITCTSSGLKWVEMVTSSDLTSVEEVSF